MENISVKIYELKTYLIFTPFLRTGGTELFNTNNLTQFIIGTTTRTINYVYVIFIVGSWLMTIYLAKQKFTPLFMTDTDSKCQLIESAFN